uniref:Large ribosomal subunit protein bL17 n=1 Tax=candidate division WWE3 bacterium TaxID=2053526 RepID=A0A7C4TIR9_UNCKA
MRHNVVTKTFNRDTEHRKAMIKNLASSLVENESLKTTVSKAKYLRPYIEKLITKARLGGINAIKSAIVGLGSESLARKLVNEIAPRYLNRMGGYTRIVRLSKRIGDMAEIARIEFVSKKEAKEEKAAKKPESKTKTKVEKLEKDKTEAPKQTKEKPVKKRAVKISQEVTNG